jgi:hypothetical protein
MMALMMEVARISEALVNFYQTTRRYNPEVSHLQQAQVWKTTAWKATKNVNCHIK